MKKKLRVTSFLMMGIFMLAACGNGESSTGSDTAEVPQKMVATATGELATLDSALYSDVTSSDAIGQIFEGLYRIDGKNNPELGLAESEPDVSEDGKTYTFKLREAVWSNGDAVTAEDFVYAFQKVVDPENGSPSSNQMDIFKNAAAIRNGEMALEELGVKAVDEKTLELTLENPITYLPKLLTGTPFFPQNKNFAGDQGQQYGTHSDKVVTNGPFTISKWNGTNLNWTFTKNPEYWDAENVKMEQIDVEVIKETSTGVNLFDSGDVQYTTLANEYAKQYQDSPDYHDQLKFLYGYVSYNEKREITGNVHLRRALSLAVDKEVFTNTVLNDGSQPLNGIIPAGYASNPETDEDFRAENGDFLAYDVEAAQAEWETAKKELGQTEIQLELLTSDTEASKKTGEFLQAQFEQNLPGLSISLRNVPLKNRLNLTEQGEFDMAFSTWTPDYEDPINFLEIYQSTGGLNTSGYVSEAYDQGINEVKSTLAIDPLKRWEKMLELEKLLIEQDAVITPIYQGAQAYLLAPEVKNLLVLPLGRTVSYRLVSIEE
ncbi:peptide ABC transporter substrate-binding protein [Carnobacterium antarcticum]|uniref:Peptide ABC transporter substrate-binding protein n=1 Tax=Carnobacterium antarcticum TaxID=2126436 RepID=A0ABW4NLM0_9LACT|nr:peptide ABC transporter substrate-binding protein [Carnobacterium sp. CP1]ALV21790.1 Oligopeptide ABC transporter, periplasmic oligopeptide-binding protein OppA [Carnobacterium sp. CP1]